MQRVLVVLVGLGLGCAARPQPSPELVARGDAELLQGCYDCLIAARASYRRAAAPARVFEADLLIGLRELELGLPASDALVEARRIAGELPREVEAARYVALVEAIPSSELGMPRRDWYAWKNAHRLAASPAERAWLAAGKLRKPVRDYLTLALQCAYPSRQDAPPPAAGPPLLLYRGEACGFGRKAVLEAVRAREPRFVETSLFLATIEIALAAREEPEHAKEHIAEAMAKFPSSPAIAYLMAAYDQFVSDFAGALPLYDRVLAAVPAHERAMLGRAVCLTNLERHIEAIDAATALIDRRADDEAYYWRARNRHALGQLREARADITSAKELLSSADVLSLAGIIEFDQGELEAAHTDLTAAIAAEGRDCTARWYIALVERQRKHWLDAGRGFEQAMGCYRDRAKASSERIPVLEARLRDPGHLARAVASLRESIEADGKQQHLAALLAANAAAAGGERAQATALLEVAGEDPALAERVAKLRDWLAAHPRP